MKQYNRKPKAYSIDVEVSYLPFPSEEARINAYDVQAKLFLKAKERMLKQQYELRKPDSIIKYGNKKGRLETALSSLD